MALFPTAPSPMTRGRVAAALLLAGCGVGLGVSLRYGWGVVAVFGGLVAAVLAVAVTLARRGEPVAVVVGLAFAPPLGVLAASGPSQYPVVVGFGTFVAGLLAVPAFALGRWLRHRGTPVPALTWAEARLLGIVLGMGVLAFAVGTLFVGQG